MPSTPGVRLRPALLPPDDARRWRLLIDAVHAAAIASSEPSDDFSRASSSLRLRAVPTLPLSQVLAAIGAASLRREVEALLGLAPGTPLQLLTAQCWVRRQYPTALAPRGHSPHQWHQDGALHFDFAARPEGAGADELLPMATCWIALDDCGRDAPGLEWIEPPRPRLAGLRELDDRRLRATHPASAFVVPTLSAGDALLIGPAVLHRTQPPADTTRVRTSLELRVVAGPLPARLDGEPREPLAH